MRDDALPWRRILAVAAGLAGIVALAMTVALGVAALRHVPPGGVPVARPAPPPSHRPDLETAPQDELAAQRRREAEELDRPPVASAPASLQPAPGATLPMHTVFVDSTGRRVALGEAIAGRTPVLMELGYDHCPRLCGLVLQGVLEAAHDAGLPADAYRLLFVSIDPRDTPADAVRQRGIARDYARFVAGDSSKLPDIRMLVGTAQGIRALTDSLGYRFASDPGPDGTRFAHPAALFVVGADGRLVQALGGVRFDAQALRAALGSRPGGALTRLRERVALVCGLDPDTGRFSMGVLALARAVGLATLGALAAVAWRARRRGGR